MAITLCSNVIRGRTNRLSIHKHGIISREKADDDDTYLLCRLDCRDKCETEAVRTRGESSSGSGGAGGRHGDSGRGGGGVTDLICLLLIPPEIELAPVMVVIHAADDAANGDADVDGNNGGGGLCVELGTGAAASVIGGPGHPSPRPSSRELWKERNEFPSQREKYHSETTSPLSFSEGTTTL